MGTYRTQAGRVHGNTKHGHSKSPTYISWDQMLARCYNAKHKSYPRYGGRGIVVCDRWRNSFEAFLEDMGVRPNGTTLERMNNKLGYSPDNCRWATPTEQGRNKENTALVEFRGKSLTAFGWAEETGLDVNTIKWRLRANWSVERSLTTPADSRKQSDTGSHFITHQGVTKSLSEWATSTGINRATIRRRIQRGWSVEDALSAPIASFTRINHKPR